jgi:hypothetical protein
MTPNYILYGVLHALAVVGALRRPIRALEVVIFVFAGGILSFSAFFVGLYFGGALGSVAPEVFIYAALGFGSAIGASTYGLVVRLFWLPQLPYSSIAFVAAGCALASLSAALLVSTGEILDAILTLTWWWTFSTLLWLQTLRPWHLTMRSSGP